MLWKKIKKGEVSESEARPDLSEVFQKHTSSENREIRKDMLKVYRSIRDKKNQVSINAI